MVNPAAAIKRRKIEVPRERDLLSEAELHPGWMAARTLSDPSRALSEDANPDRPATRRDTRHGLNEVDRPQKLWTLPDTPGTREKGDHALPLAPAAIMKLLDELPQLGRMSFHIDRRKAVRRYEAHEGDSGCAGPELPAGCCMTFGARRDRLSGIKRLPDEVAERIVNHATTGLTKIYNVHTYPAEMRTAMEAWAEQVAAVVVGDGVDADRVVAFRRTT